MTIYTSNKAKPSTNKYLTTEQFEEIVAAISEGKYSWACVLILRFAGYNPLHYIPYRTYNRLEKDNRCCVPTKIKAAQERDRQQPPVEVRQEAKCSCKSGVKVRNLDYVESIHRKASTVRGGSRLPLRPANWLDPQSLGNPEWSADCFW